MQKFLLISSMGTEIKVREFSSKEEAEKVLIDEVNEEFDYKLDEQREGVNYRIDLDNNTAWTSLLGCLIVWKIHKENSLEVA